LPEVVVDREKEQEKIRDFLQDVLKGMNGVLYVYGKPGIGKTSVTKHILKQFDELDDAVSIYLNASALTPNLALKEVYDVICGEDERKLPSPLMVREISAKLLKRNTALVIALDNFDRMDGIEDLFWSLNRLMESAGRIGLILISTSEIEIKDKVGSRLFSRLKPEFYEFKVYNSERLYEILEQRIKQSYGKMIMDSKALSTLCNFIAEECDSNVRYLFKLFLESADAASKEGESSIGLTTVEEVIERERQVIAKSRLNEIKNRAPRMHEVLKIISDLQSKQVVYTGLIKEEIRRKGLAISERSLDYYLNNLESRGLIKLKPIRKAKGKTREVRLNIPNEWISRL
jgi:Cdc6-like AAA superfamily ATPase